MSIPAPGGITPEIIGNGSDGLHGRLIVEPHPRKRYTLAELLAQPDYSQAPTPEERAWVDAPAKGLELL